MGQSQSAAHHQDVHTIEDAYTVQFSTRLLENLAGVEKHSPPPPVSPDLKASVLGSARFKLRNPSAMDKMIKEDRELEEALDRSQRVGEMLLKNEAQELGEVSRLAKEILAKEYQAPQREVPCARERDECVQCYNENINNTLKCRDEVERFRLCADMAREDFVLRARREAKAAEP